MSTTAIKLKKSSVSGKAPLVSDIDYGELALNYADGKLFYKHSGNTIRSFLDSNQILNLIDSDYLKNIINSTYIQVSRPINVVEDSAPFLGGNLNLNGRNITDSGSSGSITMSGNITGGNITATGDISGAYLRSTNSVGDEGGEITLAKPVTNTTLIGNGVTIDVYQNKLRIFEQGGGNRGVYIDITATDSSVNTNLLAGGGIANVVEDLTPELGGNLSLNSFTINGTGNINISGDITGDQIISSNNGNGTNFRVGDDVWIGDINIANTIRITGQQDSTQGYIVFGNSNNTALGRTGTGRLTYGGNAIILVGDSGTVTSSMIANTGVAAGTYGSASLVPVLTVNAQGQIDSIGTVSVAGVSSTDWDSSTGNFIISTADGGSYYTKVTLDPYTTTNLSEGANLYYTTARADSAFDLRLITKTTSNLAEGSNKYYTSARADSDAKHAISAGTGVTYSSTTGIISIGQAVGTGDTPTFNGLSASSSKITSLATPTIGTDAANKSYVDTIAAASLHYHDPVRVEGVVNLVATYDNGDSGDGATLTNADTQAPLVLDGVAVDSDDRVLIYEQTDQTQNGIYVVTHPGSVSSNWVLTRAPDANSYAPSSSTSLGKGDAFYIREGNTGAGELYVMNTDGVITFGTTNITFSQISSAQIYKAGYGIELSGTTFSVDSDRVVLSVNSLKGNITATNLLDAIITVDGAASGLDADLLDGQHGSYYRINVYNSSGTLLN